MTYPDRTNDLDRAAHPAPCETVHGVRQYTPQPAPQDIKPGGNFGRPYETEKQ